MGDKNTWLHYIGGVYRSDAAFLKEAEAIRRLGLPGVSRKMAPQTVRQMQFGDRVVFLRWCGNKGVYAFAEGVVEGLGLPTEIQEIVGVELATEGLAKPSGRGGDETRVERECGQYSVSGGGCVVDNKL